MKEPHASTGRMSRIIAAILLCIFVLWAHSYLPNQTSALTAKAIRSLHGPGFGIVALLLLRLVQLSQRPDAAYAKAAILAMLIAVVSEAAQIPIGREAQLSDLLVDALGIAGFLGISAVATKKCRLRLGRPRTIVISLLSIPAFLITLLPTLWLTGALAVRSHSMPQLLSFDSVWERAYSAGEISEPEIIPAPDDWPAGAANIARLRSAGQWGLMLHINPHADWNGYAAVSFMAATVQGETRKIAAGLWGAAPGDGGKADSYYTTITIRPSPDRYCIALNELRDRSSGRLFDLTHVHELLIGGSGKEPGIEILVDDFRLEKSTGACPNIRLP